MKDWESVVVKVGDVFDTKVDEYHHEMYYGKVEVVEFKGKGEVVIKFLNTGNTRQLRISRLLSGRIKDKEESKKFSDYKKSLKVKPKFNEEVEKLWQGWDGESGHPDYKYMPLLGVRAKGARFSKIVGKTLVDSWFYDKYYGIALIKTKTGYAQISKNKDNIEKFFGVRRDKGITTNFWLHHFIRGHTNFGKYVVDHINNDQSDNRFCNLRTATRAENGMNTGKSNGASLYKGVYYQKARDIIGSRGKQKRCWRATISVGGKWYAKRSVWY